jgi:hypothetical protein
VTIRFAPVHDAAPMLRIHLIVTRTVWSASVSDAHLTESGDNLIELYFTQSEAVVPHRQRLVPVVEVQRQSVVHIHGAERPHTLFGPADAAGGPMV